ncbi:hypothetical protein IAD21_06406 (plasmid) [Abditibacteriota bacterium]|nr:hypothetical protein IAD21_06406 [Abditibacteriota bacterium]
MAMTPLTLEQLKSIADTHSITYEYLPSESETAVATKMSRVFNIPQERMFDLFANLENHPTFFPHLKAVKVITNEDLGNVLQDNQVLMAEGLEEGGSKLGVKLFTLLKPHRIEGQLLTDPFATINTRDPKRGTINWDFERVDDNSSKMTVESNFVPDSNKFFSRGMVDHVWMDFFENTMVHLDELSQEDRFTNLLGNKTERFRTTFGE